MAPDIEVTRSMYKLLVHFLNMHRLQQPVSYLSANSATRIGSGTFYPHVARLECEGWVEGEWEVLPPLQNRPPRRFYRLTVEGAAMAQAAIERRHFRPTFLDRLMSRSVR